MVWYLYDMVPINIYHSKFDPFTFYLGKQKKIKLNFLLCLKTKEKINKFKEKN